MLDGNRIIPALLRVRDDSLSDHIDELLRPPGANKWRSGDPRMLTSL